MLTSVKCFAIAAIAVVLQLFPPTGIALMLFAAPLWSVALINLGFLILAAEALLGSAPRVTLALPLLWFGSYAIAATQSHAAAEQFEARILQKNAKAAHGWSLEDRNLVIEMGRGDNRTSGLTANWLVKDYDINRAYEHEPDDTESPYEVTWLEDWACPGSMGMGREGTRRWSKLSVGGYGTDKPRRSIRDACQFSAPTTAPERWILVEAGPVTRSDQTLLETRQQKIRLSKSDGTSITLDAGSARPLEWFPMPIIGCALNSGQAKWQCFAGFKKQSLYGQGKDGPRGSGSRVVADALGLERIRLEERFAGRY